MMEADEIADKLTTLTQSVYSEHRERAAIRCALGDAATLCDALTRDIQHENRGYDGKGPVTKRGREMAAIAKRCGNAIWAMREKVAATRDMEEVV